MTKIRAIVFDMDGVLIDAKDWHYEALNRALNLFGFNISRYDHLVTFDGLPTRKKLEMLSREQQLPPELHHFLNELKQCYTLETVHAKCKPRFQHEYAMSRLKADGYKLAVASNSVRQSVELMMEKSQLLPYLDAIVSNQDVVKPKPAPDIYRKAAEIMGVKTSECLVLEDNPNGIASARAAGCPLMVVHETSDVTYDRILTEIKNCAKPAKS
ncbi:MAG TPA: HAD family phosphatase [Opitutales bacterium]|jgi:beta-phosphoglucomutase|nr:HAD family phosphatase [Opitutales bacterium]